MNFTRITQFVRAHVQKSHEVDAAKSARSPATKPLDCIYILGPGHSESMPAELRRLALGEGLSVKVIGDGKGGISRQMIHDVRAQGLIGPHTQVICMLHGGTKRIEGSEKKSHVLHTGFEPSDSLRGSKERKSLTSTADFLTWLREPLSPSPDDPTSSTAWQGSIHLASCYLRAFPKEFYPEQDNGDAGDKSSDPPWGKGNVFLYGSNKPIFHEVSKQNFASVLGYLGECKREGQVQPDIAEMFRRVMIDSPETVSLIGDGLPEVVVSHGPKTLLEALPGYVQAQWQQMMAQEKLKGLPVSTAKDKEIDTKVQRAKKFPPDPPSISREKTVWFFFTRLSHLKTEQKLGLLGSDLGRYPWLANIRASQGTTPLMIIAGHSLKFAGAGVNACDIAKVLLESGADINAQDQEGRTALSYAIKAGNKDLVALLLNSGARADMFGQAKQGALHSVCLAKKNCLPVLKALLAKVDRSLIDKRDNRGKTALHLAIASGQVDMVKALLEAGADPEKRTRGWESPKSIARSARISDAATDQMIKLLNDAIANKKKRPA